MTIFNYIKSLNIPIIQQKIVVLDTMRDKKKTISDLNSGQSQSVSIYLGKYININGLSNLTNLFEVYCLKMSTTISTTFILKKEIIFNFLPDKTYQKPPISGKLVSIYIRVQQICNLYIKDISLRT